MAVIIAIFLTSYSFVNNSFTHGPLYFAIFYSHVDKAVSRVLKYLFLYENDVFCWPWKTVVVFHRAVENFLGHSLSHGPIPMTGHLLTLSI